VNEGSDSRSLDLVWVAPLVALVASLAALLNRYSFWRDEALTYVTVDDSFVGLLRTLVTTTSSESAFPLYYVLLWPWAQVSSAEVWLRLPSLVAAVAAALVLCRALQHLGCATRSARAGALFLALPAVSWYALEARPYGFLFLVVSLHLLESLRLVRGETDSPLGLVMLTLAVCLTYVVAGAASLLVLAVVMAQPQVRSRVRPQLTSWRTPVIVAALALSSAVLLSGLLRSGDADVPQGRSPLTFLYAIYELVFGRSLGFAVPQLRAGSPRDLLTSGPVDLVVLAAAGALIAWGVVGALTTIDRGRDRELIQITLIWIAVGAAFSALALARGFPLLGRHLLFLLPAVVVVVTVGMARRPARDRVVLAVGVLATGFVAVGGIALGERYEKDDYREAASIIESCGWGPADVAVVTPINGLIYYDPRFSDVDEVKLGPALDDLSAGEVEALVVDTANVDRGGAITDDVAAEDGWHVSDLAVLRFVTRVPLAGHGCG
jgi:hypothetical protein